MLDPMENSLFDIPAYEHTEDEAFAAFPPPASPGGEDGRGQMAGMEDWDGNRESPQKEELPKPTRKTVKRNIPKLDADRLTSERGLPALRTMFNDTKFKGKGHEVEDLKLLMSRMEHWAHRLYPKLGFEDFIGKLEVLGSKKPVQTCLKRIRMDLPIVHDDFTSGEGVELEGTSNGVNLPVDDFDMHLPSENVDHFSQHVSVKANSPPPSQSSPFLSEEQRLRMERNKQLALERRLAKIHNSSQTQDALPPPTPVPLFAEVKARVVQEAEELDSDMDATFLDALVAAAAESEASVIDCATSMASVPLVEDAAETPTVEDEAGQETVETPALEGAANTDLALVDADEDGVKASANSITLLAELAAATTGSTTSSAKDESTPVIDFSAPQVTVHSETAGAKDATHEPLEEAAADPETSAEMVFVDSAVTAAASGGATFTEEVTEAAAEVAADSVLSAAECAADETLDKIAADFDPAGLESAVDTVSDNACPGGGAMEMNGASNAVLCKIGENEALNVNKYVLLENPIGTD